MNISYRFVNYGETFEPEENTIVLDVGMKTVPGVIDHHHPQAEPECTASLIVKYPQLVLHHLNAQKINEKDTLQIITHRLPDFDAISSIFLCLKLLEKGQVDSPMEKIASYAKMVDSASLPKEVDLTATPYSILRALFSGRKGSEEEISIARIHEGLRFMKFLYSKSLETYEIIENRALFSGIDRYEQAMRKCEDDYFNYLSDVERGQKLTLYLPSVSEIGKKHLDGLIVRNPRSFLLKEWARRDRHFPPQGEGFAFLMTNFTNRRYILGVDPEKGVNLRGLGSLLNNKEEAKRFELKRPFLFRWYEGNCPFFNYRIIDSPQDGTSLTQGEIVEIVSIFSQHLEKDNFNG